MTNKKIQSTGCCEPFDPKPWQNKEINWKEKLVVKDHVTSFLHIPLNMGKIVIKNMELIEKAHAEAPYQLMLTDETSPWGSDIYIDVSKNVSGAHMAKLSGMFLTKVFEGPYQNVGTWAREMKKYIENKGKNIKKIYYSYTTCPK